ncbi:MAG: hypothetical protein HQL01_05570 [Nitrospirae bacterium]|nr:hypothetical protein [Nitrospirota bacterium]
MRRYCHPDSQRGLFAVRYYYVAITCIILSTLLSYGSAFAACAISQTNIDNNINASPVGQSFTATCTGIISSIVVTSAANLACTLNIYSGESVAGGNLLSTQAVNLVNPGITTITISGTVNVTSGS